MVKILFSKTQYIGSCALNDMILDILLIFFFKILSFNHEIDSFQMERRQTSTKKRKNLLKLNGKFFPVNKATR